MRNVPQSDQLSENTGGSSFISIARGHNSQVTPEQQRVGIPQLLERRQRE
jgi:hypothetical protein